MTHDTRRFFVITGGPGAGKTALLDALEAAGHARSIEAGRAIIQEQVAVDGPALPWKDAQLFAERMLEWEISSWRAAAAKRRPVYFDRGVPDVAGFLALSGLAPPAHLLRAIEDFRYSPTVFIAPPWREIYVADAERKQDFAEAVRTFEAVGRAYDDARYSLVELPRASIRERVGFILDHTRG